MSKCLHRDSTTLFPRDYIVIYDIFHEKKTLVSIYILAVFYLFVFCEWGETELGVEISRS